MKNPNVRTFHVVKSPNTYVLGLFRTWKILIPWDFSISRSLTVHTGKQSVHISRSHRDMEGGGSAPPPPSRIVASPTPPSPAASVLPVSYTIIIPTTHHKCAGLQNKGFLQLFIVPKGVRMMPGLHNAGILLCRASREMMRALPEKNLMGASDPNNIGFGHEHRIPSASLEMR